MRVCTRIFLALMMKLSASGTLSPWDTRVATHRHTPRNSYHISNTLSPVTLPHIHTLTELSPKGRAHTVMDTITHVTQSLRSGMHDKTRHVLVFTWRTEILAHTVSLLCRDKAP